MDFLSKLKAIAKERGTTLTAFERELGFGNNSIKRWNKSSPSIDKVIKLANYLDISLDWLLLDKSTLFKSDITKSDEQILSLYKSASPSEQEKVKHYLEVATKYVSYVSKTGNEGIIYDFGDKTSSFVAEESTYNIGLQKLPVRGYVAAGTPIEAIDNELETIEVSSEIDADYALIVNGNSMYPVIKDGEYVYVKSIEELNNNDIGVFYYNGSVTCKKFFRNDVMIKLISINPTYEDFIFLLDDAKNENINFKIEGKVILSSEQRNRLNK